MNAETSDFQGRCHRLLEELWLVDPGEPVSVTPLTGGVASDIALIEAGPRRLCVKFALARLKVAEDWQAPVHRNLAEYRWLEAAAGIAPEAVPALFGHSAAESGFAMEYVAGTDVRLWKASLLQGAPDRGEAAAVGALLGRIHAASAAPDFYRAPFRNRDDFRALRLEPYLAFTAARHPALAERLHGLIERLFAADRVLVHGDVSPKNILFRGDQPILLDAECATMGDASFDAAFCLNHLILKALHLPASRSGLFADAGRLWDAYVAHVDWEDPEALEARVCALVPALMLARVDGKSPVEYLTEPERQLVRAFASPLIAAPVARLAELVGTLQRLSRRPNS